MKILIELFYSKATLRERIRRLTIELSTLRDQINQEKEANHARLLITKRDDIELQINELNVSQFMQEKEKD